MLDLVLHVASPIRTVCQYIECFCDVGLLLSFAATSEATNGKYLFKSTYQQINDHPTEIKHIC